MLQYWYGQSMKGGHMRRKVLMFSLAFVVAGAVAVGVVGGIPAKADNQKVAQEELFTSETIKDDGDNEYVKLNNTHAKEFNTKALVKGTKTGILISKDDGKVVSVRANNKKVKVTNKKNKIYIYGRKHGKSNVTINTSKKVIKYYVYVAKKEIIRNDNPSKTGIKLIKARKVNHNIELRLKISNSTQGAVEYECGYQLKKKNGKKWKKIKLNKDIEGLGECLAGKGSIEFSHLLSNDYGNLEKGKYKISYLINEKRKYVKFTIK